MRVPHRRLKDENKVLSKGQKARLIKKDRVHWKKEILAEVVKNQKIAKVGKPLATMDELAEAIEEPQFVVKPKGKKSGKRLKPEQIEEEILRIQGIMALKEFNENPINAIQTHLQNSKI